MAADIWSFRDQTLGGLDLTGFDVEAIDGRIGRVDEATYDVGSSYIVVDTGPWILGKRVILPAGVIDRLDAESSRLFVNRTKEEIKNAPEYDPERAADEEYRGELGTYYGAEKYGGPALSP